MGANPALLVAAQHLALVSALVVVEGSPDGPDVGEAAPDSASRIQQWLVSWPARFADRDAARACFADQGLAPDALTAGLEHTPRSVCRQASKRRTCG